MTKYRQGTEAEQFERLIDRRPFVTAAGLLGNQKIDMDRLSRESSLYHRFVTELGEWALRQQVQVITAVPNGANRFGRDVARRVDLPFAGFIKRGKGVVAFTQVAHGLDLLQTGARVGIVEDVRSTGYSTLRFAKRIPGEVVACNLIDRGIDVAGVYSLAQTEVYAAAHPHSPPAHIVTPFPYETLVTFPLPLLEEPKES